MKTTVERPGARCGDDALVAEVSSATKYLGAPLLLAIEAWRSAA